MYYTTYGRVCGSPHQPAKNTTNGVNAQTRVKKLHEVVTTIISTTGTAYVVYDFIGTHDRLQPVGNHEQRHTRSEIGTERMLGDCVRPAVDG